MNISPHAPEHKNTECFGGGSLEALQNFVAVCDLLREQLWDTGKKFRVTIECDPERKGFIMKREPIDP